MHLIYQVLSYLVFGGAMPFLLLHPKLRDGVRRRFGSYRDVTERPWPSTRGKGPRIWLHGASAGDLLALLPIMREIRALEPEATLIVSTMTNSGYAIATDRLRGLVDGVTYVPYDMPGCVRRTIDVVRPDLLVLEYAELWPNLIHEAKRSGAKLALTNGRISEALVGRYRLLNALFGNQLRKFDLLLMREEVEADRALTLGAPRDRVKITGNTKFDNLAEPPPAEAVDALRRTLRLDEAVPVWVAGSTHEGEERALVRCFRGMRSTSPRLRMLLAPRYVERAGRLESMIRSEGFKVALRSQAERDPAAVADADVVLLDSMGELATAYGLATLVFVGGSFVRRGGQNILEPAGQGRPVLFGPHMMNFRDAVEVLLGRGGIQLGSPSQLEKVARELLERPDELKQLGEMAFSAVQKARGASRRNAELLLGLCR